MPLQKQYNVKIFDQDGTTFRKNVNPASLRFIPSFTSRINGIYSPIVLELIGDDFHFDDFGEGTWIDFMNIVQVEVVDSDNPSGRTIFKGFISSYAPFVSKDSEGVRVTVLHVGALLSRSYFKNGGSFTVTKSTMDPKDIFEDIIDHFNTIYGGSLLSYSASSIPSTVGTNVSITFTDRKWFDALQDTAKLAGEGWFWKVDATGVVHFKAKPATVTHTFIVDRHVDEMEVVKDSEKVVNDVQVRRSGGTATDYDDSASQVTFGTGSPATGKATKIVTDTQLTDVNAADQRGDFELNENKDEKLIAKSLVINSSYDLESILPGEGARMKNYDSDNTFFLDNMLIAAVRYDGNQASLEFEDEALNFAAELDAFVNG